MDFPLVELHFNPADWAVRIYPVVYSAVSSPFMSFPPLAFVNWHFFLLESVIYIFVPPYPHTEPL